MEKASVVERSGQYLREVRAEVRKVVWPDLRRTGIYTVVVLITIGILGLLVYVFDLIFGALLSHV